MGPKRTVFRRPGGPAQATIRGFLPPRMSVLPEDDPDVVLFRDSDAIPSSAECVVIRTPDIAHLPGSVPDAERPLVDLGIRPRQFTIDVDDSCLPDTPPEDWFAHGITDAQREYFSSLPLRQRRRLVTPEPPGDERSPIPHGAPIPVPLVSPLLLSPEIPSVSASTVSLTPTVQQHSISVGPTPHLTQRGDLSPVPNSFDVHGGRYFPNLQTPVSVDHDVNTVASTPDVTPFPLTQEGPVLDGVFPLHGSQVVPAERVFGIREAPLVINRDQHQHLRWSGDAFAPLGFSDTPIPHVLRRVPDWIHNMDYQELASGQRRVPEVYTGHGLEYIVPVGDTSGLDNRVGACGFLQPGLLLTDHGRQNPARFSRARLPDIPRYHYRSRSSLPVFDELTVPGSFVLGFAPNVVTELNSGVDGMTLRDAPTSQQIMRFRLTHSGFLGVALDGDSHIDPPDVQHVGASGWFRSAANFVYEVYPGRAMVAFGTRRTFHGLPSFFYRVLTFRSLAFFITRGYLPHDRTHRSVSEGPWIPGLQLSADLGDLMRVSMFVPGPMLHVMPEAPMGVLPGAPAVGDIAVTGVRNWFLPPTERAQGRPDRITSVYLHRPGGMGINPVLRIGNFNGGQYDPPEDSADSASSTSSDEVDSNGSRSVGPA